MNRNLGFPWMPGNVPNVLNRQPPSMDGRPDFQCISSNDPDVVEAVRKMHAIRSDFVDEAIMWAQSHDITPHTLVEADYGTSGHLVGVIAGCLPGVPEKGNQEWRYSRSMKALVPTASNSMGMERKLNHQRWHADIPGFAVLKHSPESETVPRFFVYQGTAWGVLRVLPEFLAVGPQWEHRSAEEAMAVLRKYEKLNPGFSLSYESVEYRPLEMGLRFPEEGGSAPLSSDKPTTPPDVVAKAAQIVEAWGMNYPIPKDREIIGILSELVRIIERSREQMNEASSLLNNTDFDD